MKFTKYTKRIERKLYHGSIDMNYQELVSLINTLELVKREIDENPEECGGIFESVGNIGIGLNDKDFIYIDILKN